mmetsp:Transcript_11903/g.32942  ORF Transcript_11903/g.32942 Transcript_11903/m.32942 type:complete len:207 (-) Transcript_11903:99-719(-)
MEGELRRRLGDGGSSVAKRGRAPATIRKASRRRHHRRLRRRAVQALHTAGVAAAAGEPAARGIDIHPRLLRFRPGAKPINRGGRVLRGDVRVHRPARRRPRAVHLRGRAQARAAGHRARALLLPQADTRRARGSLLFTSRSRRVLRGDARVFGRRGEERVERGGGEQHGGVQQAGRAAARAGVRECAGEEDAGAGCELDVYIHRVM